MARRLAHLPNDVMTREQLEDFHRNLTLPSPDLVKERNRQAADRCRFLELPAPRVIQELVVAWRALWKWRH